VKVVIVGCGRVGAVLAEAFDSAGHDVVILDVSTRAFDRLHASFGGSAVRGDGTDEDTLRRAGAEDAELFLAMTEGDNRNVMAAQIAVEALRARQVIAKINDPVRAAAYAALGIAALCRTTLMADAVLGFLGLPTSGWPGIVAPTGTHPGGEHHAESASMPGAGTTVALPGATPGSPGPGVPSEVPVDRGPGATARSVSVEAAPVAPRRAASRFSLFGRGA
jgi:trk system potassium uptake protein TrkA